MNDLYDLALRDTAEGIRLFWQMKEDRRNWRESREGAYLLRTNLKAETAEELWWPWGEAELASLSPDKQTHASSPLVSTCS